MRESKRYSQIQLSKRTLPKNTDKKAEILSELQVLMREHLSFIGSHLTPSEILTREPRTRRIRALMDVLRNDKDCAD